MIIVVNSGDTLFSLSSKYGIPVQKIIADNGISDETLVVGQSLIIAIPQEYSAVMQPTTANELAAIEGIDVKTLFRNNFFLGGRQDIQKGSFVVLSYQNPPQTQKIIGGYAYDFISTNRLFEVINYLTYIIPFTYGFNEEGALIVPNDDYILQAAQNNDVCTLMHVSTLSTEGTFDSNLPSLIFSNPLARDNLINNILSVVTQKNYCGVDVDFEYLPKSERENYIAFIELLSTRLHEIEKILVVALAPKTSDEQQGLLYEGLDYEGIGKYADYTLIMSYEYGYRFGPAMAVSPVNQVRRVLDYAVTRIPREKLLLGISNYGYDWTLPFVRDESDAPSISPLQAIELAKKYGAEISFDELSQAPFFFYTDEQGRRHEVWFEDARSFKAKADLMEQYNMAGGFIWEIGRENPQGYVTINSLVKIS